MRCLRVGAAVLVPAMLVAHGCGAGVFGCQDDAQCENGAVAGRCEPTGGCSFPDDQCASGRRYGEHTPEGLAGQCVDAEVVTIDTGDPTDVLTTSDSVTFTATTPADGDSSADATTMAASASVGTDSSGATLSGTSSTDGSTDAESTGGNVGAFFDPFDRPNGLDLGNGWIEKTPGAFRLVDEQVELEMVNGEDFRDSLFYRPLAESLLDVEASMVVNFVADAPFGYPQLHVRVQADDVDTPGSLTSYAVFVDSADPMMPLLTVNRIAGPGFGRAQSESIEPPPIDAETYRLRARVTGTDPVTVEGFFEVLVEGAWELRTTATLVDTANDRITEAGTIGASGHLELEHFALDDFSYAPIEE